MQAKLLQLMGCPMLVALTPNNESFALPPSNDALGFSLQDANTTIESTNAHRGRFLFAVVKGLQEIIQ